MSTHLDPLDIERYVTGANDEIDARAVVEHLAGCDVCSDAVGRQAELELLLEDAAKEATFCIDCGSVLSADICALCGAAAKVDGFRLEKVLVKSGHGRMYLATDREGRRVALKELVFVQAPDLSHIDSFEREARVLRSLEHPRIPKFYASFCVGEGVATRLYLAQEFIDGESLLDRLRGHVFDEPEAIAIARDVLEVLVYLQERSPKVFHRDVKPANLLRRPDGSVVLVDFGAARDLGPTASTTLIGTIGYAPVEQLAGVVDATSDLYALGASLCQLLTRCQPHDLMDRAVRRRMNVSPSLASFVDKLMAPKAKDRYASAREALEALADVSSSRRRVRPRTAAWAAVLVMVGAGAAAALALRGGGERPLVPVVSATATPSAATAAPSPNAPPHTPSFRADFDHVDRADESWDSARSSGGATQSLSATQSVSPPHALLVSLPAGAPRDATSFLAKSFSGNWKELSIDFDMRADLADQVLVGCLDVRAQGFELVLTLGRSGGIAAAQLGAVGTPLKTGLLRYSASSFTHVHLEVSGFAMAFQPEPGQSAQATGKIVVGDETFSFTVPLREPSGKDDPQVSFTLGLGGFDGQTAMFNPNAGSSVHFDNVVIDVTLWKPPPGGR